HSASTRIPLSRPRVRSDRPTRNHSRASRDATTHARPHSRRSQAANRGGRYERTYHGSSSRRAFTTRQSTPRKGRVMKNNEINNLLREALGRTVEEIEEEGEDADMNAVLRASRGIEVKDANHK